MTRFIMAIQQAVSPPPVSRLQTWHMFSGNLPDIDYSYPEVMATKIKNPYISANEAPLSTDALCLFLKENSLLFKPGETTEHRYWLGDKEVKR